ncbi:Short-chain dehydrogenase/reductase SDR [Trinorchestia longiramus]|nr:Short-chain dehydrogenase/reductase SDR [Trinorchestia longiramus]
MEWLDSYHHTCSPHRNKRRTSIRRTATYCSLAGQINPDSPTLHPPHQLSLQESSCLVPASRFGRTSPSEHVSKYPVFLRESHGSFTAWDLEIMWWLLLIIVTLASILLAGKYIYKLRSGWCYSSKRLDGKLIIVTGASAGIGIPTALDMAQRGARVILACRNLAKAQNVADDIKKATGNNSVIVKKLDLASLASVRAFANDILRTEKALHILINNAGTAGSANKTMTQDGLELTMQANHFGHFLLTNMLGGLLKAGAPSRVVLVSSSFHAWSPKMCEGERVRGECEQLGLRPIKSQQLSRSRIQTKQAA